MTKPVYIVDVVGQVVQAVQAQVLSTIQANDLAANGQTLIHAIDYQYGHLDELIQTLAQMDGDTSTRVVKYPLIYLVQDFRERRGQEAGVYASVSLNIIIAHQTEPTDKITDRMVKVFKPVLYPIYYSLKEQLAKSAMILQGSEDMIPEDKFDRAYWGTQKVGGTAKNTLNDFVDAIELQNLQLKINYQPCL